MKYIHIRIIELLEEKGISKNRICKDLDLPSGNFKPSPKTTKNHQKLLPWSLKSKIGTSPPFYKCQTAGNWRKVDKLCNTGYNRVQICQA